MHTPDEDAEYLRHNADADEDVAYDLDNRTSGDITAKPWAPPRAVTTWPCRTCGCPVAISQDDVERLAICNARCAQQGWMEIREHEVMWCSRCATKARLIAEALAEEQAREVTAAIRVLRDKPEPTDLERRAAQIAPPTPDCRAVLDAEVLIRRVFGFEGDAMIRAYRTSKKSKKAKVAV